MKTNTTVDLREKEVINLCDGARLGYPCDFEFNVCDGRIIALIVPGDRGLFGSCKTEDIRIPWGNIECFGEDAILVKIDPSACRRLPERRKRREII